MVPKFSGSLSDIAYKYILEKIISFSYAPNDPIVEQDVCAELNISRTPLREALRRLEAEGYVTKVRNCGTFVRKYTSADIEESCDIRTLFELHSLHDCVAKASDEEIFSIKARIFSLTPDSAPEEYYEADSALHELIMYYGNHRRMREILQLLEVQLSAVKTISARTPNRLKSSRAEHLAIISAIEERNEERASLLLKAHLENVKASCVQAFQNMQADAQHE